jgi:hypothetical protein
MYSRAVDEVKVGKIDAHRLPLILELAKARLQARGCPQIKLPAQRQAQPTRLLARVDVKPHWALQPIARNAIPVAFGLATLAGHVAAPSSNSPAPELQSSPVPGRPSNWEAAPMTALLRASY